MRKTSDIAMLLGSRSKSRSRGSKKSLWSSLLRTVDGLLGRSKGGRSRQRGASVSTILFACGLVGAFGGGFVLGGRVGGAGGGDPLQARAPQRPGFMHEDAKLAEFGFVVSAYAVVPDDPERTEQRARQRASDLAKYLAENGLPKSRCREWREGLWVTVVYYEGDAERDHTRAVLLNLPDEVPDQDFRRSRSETDWPQSYSIQ